MANRTDPLIAQVSGSDPQNLMEYLTRQRIYDSRYWKETCFGLTVESVLEESARTFTKKNQAGPIAIGHLQFLALTLKLLQLHPDTDLMIETFIEQEDFKYTRALGALYVRLTGRPADIYHSLETLYRDGRKLRNFNVHNATDPWSFVHMDEFIHNLLTEPHVAGITLPRLPLRRVLQEAGYLPEGSRQTALQDLLQDFGGEPLAYLKHKALVEKSPAALEIWDSTYSKYDKGSAGDGSKGRPKKKAKSFALFQDSSIKKKKSKTQIDEAPAGKSPPPEEGSEEYWNEQRAKLGLAPLKK